MSSFATSALVRTSPRPVDLVLEGGGVKGIGLVGAVLALDEAGYQFQRIAGTSAGAITAALIAALQTAGEPLDRLQDYISSVDYARFEQKGWLRDHLGPIGDAAQLALRLGLYSGDYLLEWLGGLLEEIGVTTFAQLEQADALSSLPPSCRYSLVVHTSDITRNRLVRLPWDYPAYGLEPGRQLIVDAVRASMSIPFFFDPVRLDAPRAEADGVTWEGGPVTWVDGGLLADFPVEVFDRTDGEPSRWPTVGIKLSAQKTVVSDGKACSNVGAEAFACLHTLLDNTDRYYLAPGKQARTIFVDSLGVKATDFHLTASTQAALYASGQRAAGAWLAAQPATPAVGLAVGA
jgi:NTE family protein